MKFSLHVQTRITDWHFIKDLENLKVWRRLGSRHPNDVERLLFNNGISGTNYVENQNQYGSGDHWHKDYSSHSMFHFFYQRYSARSSIPRHWNWPHRKANSGSKSDPHQRI